MGVIGSYPGPRVSSQCQSCLLSFFSPDSSCFLLPRRASRDSATTGQTPSLASIIRIAGLELPPSFLAIRFSSIPVYLELCLDANPTGPSSQPSRRVRLASTVSTLIAPLLHEQSPVLAPSHSSACRLSRRTPLSSSCFPLPACMAINIAVADSASVASSSAWEEHCRSALPRCALQT